MAFFLWLFFCVSNIMTKKPEKTSLLFGVVLVVIFFSLSNIVILLLVESRHQCLIYWPFTLLVINQVPSQFLTNVFPSCEPMDSKIM